MEDYERAIFERAVLENREPGVSVGMGRDKKTGEYHARYMREMQKIWTAARKFQEEVFYGRH